MPRFGRVLTAMATPFDEDGMLDLDGAQALAFHLVEHGSDGLVVAGTTGESPTLRYDETLALFRTVVEAAGERATVLAGTGKNDTAATVELTRAASRLGVDGILSVTGYYNRPSQRGLGQHFRAVAAATDLPVMVYNVPSRTANEIAPATLLDLATSVDNVVAVKDAVGDPTKTSWLAARQPDNFEIYSGDDAKLLPLLAVGAVGVVSVAAHLVGTELSQLVDVFPTDPAKAREIHFRLSPLFEALFADTSPGPLKTALGLVGLPAGPLRLPLTEPDAAVVRLLGEVLAGLGFDVRASGGE